MANLKRMRQRAQPDIYWGWEIGDRVLGQAGLGTIQFFSPCASNDEMYACVQFDNGERWMCLAGLLNEPEA